MCRFRHTETIDRKLSFYYYKNMSENLFRRHIFLINRPFQLKFAFYVCSWILVLSLVYPFVIYGIFDRVLALTVPSVSGPDALKALHDTRTELLQMLVLFHILFILLVAILSIFVSHRIAGPLFKLKRTMEEIQAGHWDQKVVFRSGDYFKEIAESFNQLTGEIQRHKDRRQEATKNSIDLLEKMSGRLSGEEKNLADKATRELRSTLE